VGRCSAGGACGALLRWVHELTPPFLHARRFRSPRARFSPRKCGLVEPRCARSIFCRARAKPCVSIRKASYAAVRCAGSASASASPAAANAQLLARDRDGLALLLSLLEEEDFYVRYHTTQLLTELVRSAPKGCAREGGRGLDGDGSDATTSCES
jgi:hypothetical protein